MNKAFVKEIDADARVMCPKCGTIGIAVGKGPLDTHVRTEARSRISDSAWCCGNSDCSVVYFNLFDQTVTTDELNTPVYPYNLDAPICQCFGFTYDDVDHDSRDAVPHRIREMVAKSKSPDARCQALAVDGQCCLREVQRLYLKLRSGTIHEN